MTTLQEYLNGKYPTSQDKEQVQKIDTQEIKKERDTKNITDILEGNLLDLSEFKNLQTLVVDRRFLSTPLTKVIIDGLANLKELDFPNLDRLEKQWKGQTTDTDEQTKLWKELDIENDDNQKNLIRELQRLTTSFSNTYLSNKKINLYFANDKVTKTQLDNKNGWTEKNSNGELDLYLQLERKDKNGTFSPSLVLWTFTQELTHSLLEQKKENKEISYSDDLSIRFSPLFWKHFLIDPQSTLEWLRKEIALDYQDLVLTIELTNFNLKIFDLDTLSLYLQDQDFKVFYKEITKEDLQENPLVEEKVVVNNKWINETWKTITSELITLTNKELENKTDPKEIIKLWSKLSLEYKEISEEWTITANYHSLSPLHKEIEQLILTTSLRMELEETKKVQASLPTNENFEKLTKQNQKLEDYLHNYADKNELKEIKDKINKI